MVTPTGMTVVDTSAPLILQIMGGVFSVGAIQLIIYVFNRRSSLRNLDATTGSTALASANTYIETLQAGERETRDEGTRLRVRIEALESKHDIDTRKATATIDNAREEIERLSADLARARSDLAVAHSQIRELGRQIATGRTP